MLTHSDDDNADETTKYRKRNLSKSEQKDPRNFKKVIDDGPSPMSFGNIIDELLGSSVGDEQPD